MTARHPHHPPHRAAAAVTDTRRTVRGLRRGIGGLGHRADTPARIDAAARAQIDALIDQLRGLADPYSRRFAPSALPLLDALYTATVSYMTVAHRPTDDVLLAACGHDQATRAARDRDAVTHLVARARDLADWALRRDVYRHTGVTLVRQALARGLRPDTVLDLLDTDGLAELAEELHTLGTDADHWLQTVDWAMVAVAAEPYDDTFCDGEPITRSHVAHLLAHGLLQTVD